MPASTLDPVSASLRNALAKTSSSMDNNTALDNQIAGTTKKALLANIEFEAAGSYQSNVLDKLKSKYIVLKANNSTPDANSNKLAKSKQQDCMISEETLPDAKHELFSHENVQLGWTNTEWSVGAGMVNMGNTCYLNSTLQALFHVPALVNWIISDKQHTHECEDTGSHCVICAMRKTLLESQQRNVNSIRPYLIFNKLRVLCRHLVPGRQEDAHEFLRYLVEAMEKSYLNRFKNHSQFDARTKETTPLNQILGGYLRSAVRCLVCGHVSTTFQHFQDLLLDIRKAQSVEEALEAYFSREHIDDESYHCEACQKKVRATKQFSLERAPMVLCVQLKRFSVTNNKISKNIQFKQRLELSKYAKHRPSTALSYRLVALVTHMGPTVCFGHYTAIAQAPCGNYYQFDDNMVRPISNQAVFSTNAYIMLYELERAPVLNGSKKQCTETSNGHKNGVTHKNGKTYGPELPPKKSKLAEVTSNSNNGTLVTCATATSSSAAPPSMVSSNMQVATKRLVPYDDEEDDDDGENDEVEVNNSRMENVNGSTWNVTSSQDNHPSTDAARASMSITPASPPTNTVGELLTMSHGGYSSSVPTWNGNRSQLNRDVNNEKRDERKRNVTGEEMDQGNVKHVKVSHLTEKSLNNGYNPIQEYHNAKNWGQANNNYNRSFYDRQRAHKRFNHKNNYHKSYRYRN